MTMMAWGISEFNPQLRRTGQLGNALNSLRWGTDYFLKAHTQPNELWVQVGSPWSDHDCWERPEDMTTPRPAYKVDTTHHGSDVAAETAAALAAASIAFRGVDRAYSAKLLRSAQQLFNFADRFRGKYSDSLAGVVCPFYCSYSGFNDELLWGASWLALATNNPWYSQYLLNNQYSMGGSTMVKRSLNWDDKTLGAQVLTAHVSLTETSIPGSYSGDD
jgi:endoglucanase